MSKSKFTNPYRPPAEQQLNQALKSDRMIAGGFKTIIMSTVVFGAIGTMIGWVLSVIAPAYYRYMFDAMDSELWQLGVGLGLTQGLVAGLVAGCVVVLAAAVYRSRIRSGLLREIQGLDSDSEKE